MLQAILAEQFGTDKGRAAANDLQQGDEGVGQGFRRKVAPVPRKGGKGRRRKLANDCCDEWDAEEEFEVEAIVATKLSVGVQQDGHRKGTKLYQIIWAGYAAEASTWEPESNIGDDILADYQAGLEAEAELDAEAEAELTAKEEESGGASDEMDMS